jgi:hypothetical protein
MVPAGPVEPGASQKPDSAALQPGMHPVAVEFESCSHSDPFGGWSTSLVSCGLIQAGSAVVSACRLPGRRRALSPGFPTDLSTGSVDCRYEAPRAIRIVWLARTVQTQKGKILCTSISIDRQVSIAVAHDHAVIKHGPRAIRIVWLARTVQTQIGTILCTSISIDRQVW